MPPRDEHNSPHTRTQAPSSSTCDGGDLCRRDGSRGNWRDLGRRVLSEAARLAKEQASGAARAAQQTKDGLCGSAATGEPAANATTPVPQRLEREASS